MSHWMWTRMALPDGAGRLRAGRMASSEMPGGKMQLSEAVAVRAGRRPAVITGRTERIQGLAALDDAGTAAVRLPHGDMVTDR